MVIGNRDKFAQLSDSLLTQLNHNNKHVKLAIKLSKLIKLHQLLAPKCRDYDYQDLQLNGLRSYLTVVEEFVHKLSNHARKLTKRDEKLFGDVLEILRKIGDIIEDIVLHNQTMSSREVTKRALSITQDQYKSLVMLGHFWLSDEVQKGNSCFKFMQH